MYQIDQMQPKHQVSGLESYRFITSFRQRPLFWVSVCLKVVAGTAQWFKPAVFLIIEVYIGMQSSCGSDHQDYHSM